MRRLAHGGSQVSQRRDAVCEGCLAEPLDTDRALSVSNGVAANVGKGGGPE